MALPEGCIAIVVALTSPADACRLCTVCSVFRSAVESDSVWERFLPLDYQSIISRSDATFLSRSSSSSSCFSKKQLYYSLCHNPILIDHGTKSFSLDKSSGKKCFMLSAKDLEIEWIDTPKYWRWISDPDSRFAQVAELIDVCWLEIRGKINTSMLSPETLYAAYLVFKSTTDSYGLANLPVDVSVGLVGADNGVQRSVYLNGRSETRHLYPMGRRRRYGFIFNRNLFMGLGASTSDLPKERGDGWQETELGVFFCKGGEEEELEMSVLELKSGDWKRGLVV